MLNEGKIKRRSHEVVWKHVQTQLPTINTPKTIWAIANFIIHLFLGLPPGEVE